MVNNPFSYGKPVSGSRFVGRWEQIYNVLDDITNPGGDSHALIGGRRFGKTSFLETLQGVLIKQLAQPQPGESYIFPVLISLKNLRQRSPEGVFALMLHTFYDYFHSLLLRKSFGLTLDFDVSQTQLATFAQGDAQACSLDEFSDIMEDLLNVFINAYDLLQPVFLIDEIEEILEQSWTETLFSQLRSLIYVGKLRDYIRCVFAGSSKILEVREKGSPLLNMLKVIHLETLSNEHILEIIHRADSVQTDFADAVLLQCGGHPFLAQYIMHHAWDRIRKGMATVALVSDIVNMFRSQRNGDLKQWQDDIGEAGLVAYKVLMEAETWLTEAQVKQRISDEQVVSRIGPALVSLCYHGLVLQDGTWSKYRVAGKLFKDWFTDEIFPSLHLHTPSATHDPPVTFLDCQPTVSTYLLTAIFPTAYSHSVTVARFPLVKCMIDNTCQHCTNARVTVEATIQGFSEPYTDTLDVPSGRSEQVILLPRLSREKVLSLTEIYTATCRILIRRHTESGLRELLDKTYDIQLQAFNTALFAVLDEQGDLVEDLADYLSVFVTPNKQEVQDFMGTAANEHPDKQIVGYQGAILDHTGDVDRVAARNISRREARAFFNALKKHAKLHYINSPVNFGKQPDRLTQRVRFSFQSLPSDPGQVGQANCIDGAILFASLLENIGMEPLLVLVPGHAFVGWRIWKGIDEYDFLETTWIKTSKFEDALGEGNRQYREAIQHGDHQRNFLDSDGFIRIVDITACRSRGIYALT
jgi:hypothetical protein